jgi:hypothetical protein
MPLEDFLTADEHIRFSCPKPVEYQDERFGFFITTRRLIFHRSFGLFLKKDKIVSEDIDHITEIKYEEKGVFSIRSLIQIKTDKNSVEFNGSPDVMKPIYLELNSLLGKHS